MTSSDTVATKSDRYCAKGMSETEEHRTESSNLTFLCVPLHSHFK